MAGSYFANFLEVTVDVEIRAHASVDSYLKVLKVLGDWDTVYIDCSKLRYEVKSVLVDNENSRIHKVSNEVIRVLSAICLTFLVEDYAALSIQEKILYFNLASYLENVNARFRHVQEDDLSLLYNSVVAVQIVRNVKLNSVVFLVVALQSVKAEVNDCWVARW